MNSLELPADLRRLLDRVRSQLRLRLAESFAWRGAFWGSLLAILILLFRSASDELELEIQIAIPLVTLLVGALLGAILGFLQQPTDLLAARITDRTFALNDRLATAVELISARISSDLAGALLADASSKAATLEVSNIAPRRIPSEARWMMLSILAICGLLLVPSVKIPASWLPESLLPKSEREGVLPRDERARLFGWDFNKKESLFRQEGSQQINAEKASAPESSENFRDKSTNKQRSDFASFLQKGDERLKLLERTDKLPDLQSDFATSKYRLLMQKNQELQAGNNSQISAKRLEQILREMQKMGKRGNADAWDDEVSEGIEALQDGNVDQAMSSMQSALSKLRAQEEKERNSRRIAGTKENSDQGADGGSSRGSASGDQERSGYSTGGPKTPSQGKATPRLRSTPYDAALEGQRRGRQPTVETGQTNRPTGIAQQLQTLGDLIQYRRQAEDAITREQVPRDYHDQIRDYFKSLQE